MKMNKKIKLTAIITQGESGLLCGQIKEYPCVLSQGKTVSELILNLKDALKLFNDNFENVTIRVINKK